MQKQVTLKVKRVLALAYQGDRFSAVEMLDQVSLSMIRRTILEITCRIIAAQRLRKGRRIGEVNVAKH